MTLVLTPTMSAGAYASAVHIPFMSHRGRHSPYTIRLHILIIVISYERADIEIWVLSCIGKRQSTVIVIGRIIKPRRVAGCSKVVFRTIVTQETAIALIPSTTCCIRLNRIVLVCQFRTCFSKVLQARYREGLPHTEEAIELAVFFGAVVVIAHPKPRGSVEDDDILFYFVQCTDHGGV